MKTYRTSEIAELINVHPNTVRLYEKWGYIEPVAREANGYRIYTERHLDQLRLIRLASRSESVKIQYRIELIEIMKSFVAGNIQKALVKTKLYLQQIRQEKQNVETITAQIQSVLEDESLQRSMSLKRNEVAKLLGLSIHIVIDWERNGLIEVKRQENNGYRIYTEHEVRSLKIIQILRASYYSTGIIFNLMNRIKLNSSIDSNQMADYLITFLENAETDAQDMIVYLSQLNRQREKELEKMQEYIVLKGCKENNLKNVSLNIPKRKITIFTGVSGSGKSSLVFETIGKEAQRQLNGTFSAFIQNFLPKYGEPKADYIGNLSTPIMIDQKRIGGNSRSTLGTITDINPLIRLLYSRIGNPRIPQRNHFSFNDINGMCPECEGIGKKLTVNLDKILDQSKSINEGAILLSGFGVGSWQWKLFAESGFFDNDKKIADYTSEELNKFLYGEPEKIKLVDMNMTYEGLIVKFNRLYLKKETELSDTAKKRLADLMTEGTCPLCHGARLNQEVLACTINGYNIAKLMTLQLDELIQFISSIDVKEVQPLIEQINEKLNNMIEIGLGYLSLDRETSTLSGGESQRIKMVKHLNSNLVDLMYIFDEPSIGLHPRDVHKLNQLLQKLRDKGNTVIVVEHDPDVIKIADHIVDVGPRAGRHGGQIMYEGSYEGLLESGTLTGEALKQQIHLKEHPRVASQYLSLTNCQKHNLKNISVNIPLGILTVVTGVAGSGKSTLMKQEFISQYPQAVLIDQSAVSANSRSNLTTYSGIMDSIRKAFAKANDVKVSLFSYNSEGACENCQGRGVVETNLAFMDNVKTTCEVCEGNRYKKEVLDYHYQGLSIIEVLEMTVGEALDFFKLKDIKKKLQSIEDMGLGYLTLGQPLDTLSGGECQRLKLANELHKESSIYVMDEPTTGLHLSDIERFIEIIEAIVERGNTVIIIEHNIEVIKRADWIIDLGPEAGVRGGKVIFEGTPKQLHQNPDSLTAKYI